MEKVPDFDFGSTTNPEVSGFKDAISNVVNFGTYQMASSTGSPIGTVFGQRGQIFLQIQDPGSSRILVYTAETAGNLAWTPMVTFQASTL